MIKQYVQPATISGELDIDEEACYVEYYILGLALEELNINQCNVEAHSFIKCIEFARPTKEKQKHANIYEEFTIARVIFLKNNEANISEKSECFLHNYILFIIKNTNLKIGEPIKIQKSAEVCNKKLKFIKNSNSLYQYIVHDSNLEMKEISLNNVSALTNDYMVKAIIKTLSIENPILRFVAIYEIIYRMCGSVQASTIAKITAIINTKGYAIPQNITWQHTKTGKLTAGDMLTYLRSKCAHTLETIDYSAGKIDVMLDEFAKLEHDVKMNIGGAVKILLDVLADQSQSGRTL